MPFLAVTVLAALLDAGSAAAAAGLGHSSFRIREAAHAAADKFGPYALPALRRTAAGRHAEASERATDLIATITRREENARRLAPTLVRLDRADTPVGVVLADLERQTGYRFLLPGPSAKQTRETVITVRTPGRVPFWTAVGLIADAANLSVIGVGAPQPNAQVYSGRYSSYTPPPLPPTGPVAGFVPAVEDDQRAVAERQSWQKYQDAKAKTAADAAAIEKMIAGLTKQAEKAVGLPADVPAKPAPMPAAAPPQPPPIAVIGFGTAVYLAPRTVAHPGRAVVSGAVSVEVGTVPVAVLPDFPRDVLPLSVTLTPEPKLGVQKVNEVRVTKAVAADGRIIQPLMVDAVTDPKYGEDRNGLMVRQLGGGRVFIQPANPGSRPTGPPPPPHTVLRLIAPPGSPPTLLAELSGVAVGVLRSDIGEAAFVTDLKGAQTVTGEGGTTLRAVVTGPDDEGKYSVDLTVTYAYERVIPAAAGKDEAVVAALGKVVIPKGLDPTLALDDCLHWGVVVTDDQRRPCQMVRQSTGRSRVFTMNGERYYLHTGRYVVRPHDEDPRPPARVSFYAAWPVPVEVPFTLTNVPVTAGTGAK